MTTVVYKTAQEKRDKFVQILENQLILQDTLHIKASKVLNDMRYFSDLHKNCFGPDNYVLVYIGLPGDETKFPIFPITMSASLNKIKLFYTAVSGSVALSSSVNDNGDMLEYTQFVVLTPPEEASKFLGYVQSLSDSNWMCFGPGAPNLDESQYSLSPDVDVRITPKRTAFLCSEKELVMLLLDQETDSTTKILSSLNHCFPVCKKFGHQFVDFIPFKIYQDQNDNRFREPSVSPMELSQTFMALVISACLISGYSRQDIVKDQLFRRYKAVLATDQDSAMDETSFNAKFIESGLKCTNLANQVLDFVGYSIMIDRQGQYSLKHKASDIATSQEMVDNYWALQWTCSLRDQMMIVFKNKNMTTLSLAVAVQKIMKKNIITAESVFEKELLNLQTIDAEISLSHFRCLSGTQELTLQANKIPHFAYLGLLYYERQLSEAEKANWKNYQVEAVGQHISSDSDRNLVRNFAEYLPAPSVLDAVRLSDSDWMSFGPGAPNLDESQYSISPDDDVRITPQRTASLCSEKETHLGVTSPLKVPTPDFEDDSGIQADYQKFVEEFLALLNNAPSF